MAYSPSPQPGALGGMSGNIHRSSVTPPLPRVVSKQDKRRNLLSERLNSIGAHFARDRDSFYRTQLQSLQLAMNYINNADLYKNEPLNDNPNDVFEGLSAAVADNAQRVAQTGARVKMHEVPAGSDMRVAAFIKDINDAMETRDASLTAIAVSSFQKSHREHDIAKGLMKKQNRYNDAISIMGREADYQVDVASIEHEQLATTVRDRMYQSVSKRRTKLLAERETLDLADTNTVLFYPSNHSTRPGSPGGPHSNRKTRHTRHRLEVDEMGIIAESNKRKRTENGSPTRGVDSDTNHPWKDANGKYDTQSSIPPLTLGGPSGLFPHDKDLISSLQKASRLAVHRMSKRRRVGPFSHTKQLRAKTSSKGKARETQMMATSSSSSADEAEPSDLANLLDQAASTNGDHSLEAPAMDRTANSSYHATRSTGVVSISATTFAEDLALPGDIIGRRTAIDFLGSQREPRKREDDYQRAPPLSEQERDADRQAMKRAMEEMGHGRVTKRARTIMSNAAREVANHIKAAEELIQESCLRETLVGVFP